MRGGVGSNRWTVYRFSLVFFYFFSFCYSSLPFCVVIGFVVVVYDDDDDDDDDDDVTIVVVVVVVVVRFLSFFLLPFPLFCLQRH